jgi:hypothetical protein
MLADSRLAFVISAHLGGLVNPPWPWAAVIVLRRWHEDPRGADLLLGGGLVEIHVGGISHMVAESGVPTTVDSNARR